MFFYSIFEFLNDFYFKGRFKLNNRLVIDIEEYSKEIEESKKLEIEAVHSAETGNLEKALDIINHAINLAPFKPSLYNNRAHILQYMRKFEGR